MDIYNNLKYNDHSDYIPYLKINVINAYTFTIEISEELSDFELYTILYSYIKNKNIIIKSIVAIRKQILGFEYINLINITNFLFYDFVTFRKQYLNTEDWHSDSNFDFINNINDSFPLLIEIGTFNKHNISIHTKPISLGYII